MFKIFSKFVFDNTITDGGCVSDESLRPKGRNHVNSYPNPENSDQLRFLGWIKSLHN